MSKLPAFIEQHRTQMPGNIPSARLCVNREQWLEVANAMHETGALLLSLWGADDRDRDRCFVVYAAYLLPDTLLVVEYPIQVKTAADVLELGRGNPHEKHPAGNVAEARGVPRYPSIATLFPAALRMQRGVYDMLGIGVDERNADTRGWLCHGGWPEKFFPLRRKIDGSQQFAIGSEPYPFVSVEGDGVHEIAVGPVHAGTIEPGHFRFSVVGEKVLRLEERLGYTHKGVAKCFEGLSQSEGHRLAARVSGDSAVAFSWAYCAAVEAITQIVCPARVTDLRALALEHERLANHLGDLGALGNDAGFAFGLTQFSRLKEDLLRANALAFGARYLFDYVTPGGVASDLPPDGSHLLFAQYTVVEDSVSNLRSIYAEHAGLQDRFREAGRLETGLAQKLGAVGLAARASGIPLDLRVDHPWPPYDWLAPKLIVQSAGDVAARVQVRFDEIFESLRLCRALLAGIAAGPIQISVPPAEPDLLGVGLIEGWRGPVMIALETGPDGAIRRCDAHDPSWQNWPLLEYAILGNIVPDFPLINKSFNLSYSGQDG